MFKLRQSAMVIALSFILVPNVFAAKSASDLCQNHKKQGYFKQLLNDSDNTLSFRNAGGLLNGGVCWWHSRFTRNALYLAVFRPDLPSPTPEQAAKLIKKIRKGKEVVTIPGYKNLNSFSYDYRNQIQKELEKWQIVDGFVNQQWVVGLWGGTHKPAAKLKKWMDNLYKYVETEGNIAYQKVQIKGIDAHAWLVKSMTKTRYGYTLHVLDSNSTQIRHIYYREGNTSIYDAWYGDIIPYTGRKLELKRLKRAVKKYCK